MHRAYPNLNYPPESVIINAIPIEEIMRKADEKTIDFPASPVFISVGRLHTRKGYHKLLVAHEQLLIEGFKHTVCVIGDGEELPTLLAQRKKLGVEKSFLFLGNKMNPYPYIKAADFFIMPSESEAWPLVIAEAMILEKPIIATNVGDVAMMLKDGETGLLINYKTEEIYAAMKEFLTNEKLILSLKENLKNSADKFNNAKIFEAVENIFLTLAKSEN